MIETLDSTYLHLRTHFGPQSSPCFHLIVCQLFYIYIYVYIKHLEKLCHDFGRF